MTNIRTGVPSLEVYVTWRVDTAGTSTCPGGDAQSEVERDRAS
jgi:hypothetical protein